MKKGNITLIVLLGLLLLVGAAIYLLPSDNASKTATVEENLSAVSVDDDAPNFTVEMTNGEQITLDSLRGKVVLVNFWATWCPPCREELARVQTDIIDRFAGRDFVFLPISRGEQKDVVMAFLKENGYTFAAGLDTDKAIYNSYAKDYIPRNYLINRHGVVIEATVGYDATEFETLIKTIEMSLNAR